MQSILTYLRALARGHTYDPLRNGHFWFGFVWGVPVPLFALTLDLALTGQAGRTVWSAIGDHPYHFFFMAHPLVFAAVFGAMGTVRNDLEKQNAALITTLREEAIRDPLTGLYNRRYALEEFRHMLSRADRSGRPLVAFLLDVDGFKRVNELRGHLEGDRKLRQIAKALKLSIRDGDLLARFGGDEFLLVAPGDYESTRLMVARARDAVQMASGLSISAGAGVFPRDGGVPGSLISAADSDLLSRKRTLHANEKQTPARS